MRFLLEFSQSCFFPQANNIRVHRVCPKFTKLKYNAVGFECRGGLRLHRTDVLSDLLNNGGFLPCTAALVVTGHFSRYHSTMKTGQLQLRSAAQITLTAVWISVLSTNDDCGQTFLSPQECSPSISVWNVSDVK